MSHLNLIRRLRKVLPGGKLPKLDPGLENYIRGYFKTLSLDQLKAMQRGCLNDASYGEALMAKLEKQYKELQ